MYENKPYSEDKLKYYFDGKKMIKKLTPYKIDFSVIDAARLLFFSRFVLLSGNS